jgi:hypothetical protein
MSTYNNCNKILSIILFIAATAMVVTCMMTLVTRIGPEHQKGIITGIFRSLGALARACGPIVASSGKKLERKKFGKEIRKSSKGRILSFL